jgi:hypothetical protein
MFPKKGGHYQNNGDHSYEKGDHLLDRGDWNLIAFLGQG